MANIVTDNANYTNIANAIREKNGSTDTYLPSEMAAAILALTNGGTGTAIGADVVFGSFNASNQSTVDITFDSPMTDAPNFIIFTEKDNSVGSSNRTKMGMGGTSTVLTNGSTTYYQILIYGRANVGTISTYQSSYSITTTSGTTGCPIKKATKNGFTACAYSTTYRLNGNYRYIAVNYHD